ncbi:MAG TPA: penicillin acylase family protein [Gemmataceae bacterium]|nr:penicillin acylase family protein [Gemmataceae bacterium]
MNLMGKEILRRLGDGESIDAVCAAASMSRSDFDAWWKQEAASRVPAMTGSRRARVRRSVQISRDSWGIPSIRADNDEDLFFGFGYAMAQDRLYQLDFLRRKGAGRLSEILGPDGSELDYLCRLSGLRNVFEWDLLARTVGIRRIAEHEWTELPEETRTVLRAFSAGINAVIKDCGDRLPIEFDMLGYRPEPWAPIDSLTIEGEFRWYLTGRFPVIVIPELARRTLGDGQMYRAFLEVESDAESILLPGSYPSGRAGSQPVGTAAGDPQGGGSNNWVVSGRRSATGKPLVASDPHIAFEAVSCWYEVHLCGGSFNVAGMAYAGMPAVMFGRNRHVAWGCTNNICSQRDLYQEKNDPQHPDCFLYDGTWEPARKLNEVIAVKGGPSVRKTIRFSRNGPIVDEVLPPAARQTGPVSLKWLGASRGGCLTALLGMDRAKSASEFHEAIRPWHVPTFCLVFADTAGHIGFHAAGSIPIRNVWERGYRPGWDPRHQWDGLVPFEGMPQWSDPERGWIATANNRPAPEDFPYPLSGTWSHGLRAERIRQMMEAKERFTREDFIAMQHDALSVRAQRCLPLLLNVLKANSHPCVAEAVRHLEQWDCRMEVDRVGATLFSAFFAQWTKTVVQQRFDDETATLLADGASGLAACLLAEDAAGWFAPGLREPAIRTTMERVLASLSGRLGPDMAQWTWGRVHVLPLRHFLSGRGDLGQLLDHGNQPIKGDYTTVCNAWQNAAGEARSGAGYRLIADLGDVSAGVWAVDAQSQSGHPGSPHYRDQLGDWIAGRYHYLPLALTGASPVPSTARSKLQLDPAE